MIILIYHHIQQDTDNYMILHIEKHIIQIYTFIINIETILCFHTYNLIQLNTLTTQDVINGPKYDTIQRPPQT